MRLVVTLTEEDIFRISVRAVRAVMEEQWLPGPEVARRIGASPKAWRAIAEELIAAVPKVDSIIIGKQRRWRTFDVLEYLRKKGAR